MWYFLRSILMRKLACILKTNILFQESMELGFEGWWFCGHWVTRKETKIKLSWRDDKHRSGGIYYESKEAIGPYLTTQMHALSSFIFCLQAVAYLSYIASSLFAILNPQQNLILVLFFGLYFDFPVVWCLVSVHASQSNIRKRCPATKIQN